MDEPYIAGQLEATNNFRLSHRRDWGSRENAQKEGDQDSIFLYKGCVVLGRTAHLGLWEWEWKLSILEVYLRIRLNVQGMFENLYGTL